MPLPAADAALWSRQLALQAEARRMLAELGLATLFADVGPLLLTGSFYLIDPDLLRAERRFVIPGATARVRVAPERAIDIDEPIDLSVAEAVIRASGWDGRFLVIGFPAGIPSVPLNLMLLKSCNIVGVFWGAAVARDPAAHAQNVKELMALYAAGKIRPHVSEHFPLERAGDAIAHLASRKAMGKVVVVTE